jgi:hypothetical protein
MTIGWDGWSAGPPASSHPGTAIRITVKFSTVVFRWTFEIASRVSRRAAEGAVDAPRPDRAGE